MFVDHCLATKVYIGKLPAMGWVLTGRVIMKGGVGGGGGDMDGPTK